MPVLISASATVLRNQSDMRGMVMRTLPICSLPTPLRRMMLLKFSRVGFVGNNCGGILTVAEAGVSAVTKSQ